MKRIIFILIIFLSALGHAQVTTSAMSGTVKSNTGEALPGASVMVVHKPTGSKYFSTTDFDGGYSVQGLRPGGPYTLTVTYIGYKTSEITEINAPLGSNISVNVVVQEASNTLKEVVVVSNKSNGAFNKGKTGASQQFSNRELTAIPVTGARSINSITKYNANAGGGGSFGGQDSRLNNFTIDGSVFNNGFGLGSDAQAGGRTGSTAISLDAIEQLQVSVAPFDVRQSGFTGTGINGVTRSGTNEIEGSVYTSTRSNKKEFVGTKAGQIRIVPAKFEENILGARIGAPIIKDKLFFFGNFETINNLSPATTWTATGSPQPSGQVSAPTFQQMQALSTFLQEKFNYTTGPWENYDAERISKKFLAKIDWNIDDNNKFSVRYVHHDSSSDELTSNSNSLGFGNRRTNVNSMSYRNSGYTILDNTRSIVVQLDSKLSNSWSNNFIGGYDKQIEDRGLIGGGLFPTIDIKNGTAPSGGNAGTVGNLNFIGAGLDPFTQGNKLNYSTLHFTNNLTKTVGKHSLLFGANYEHFESSNLFFSGSNGVFIFNSLDEFYSAANESIALNGAPSVNNLPVRTQFRYSALAGGAEPLQVLKSDKIDLYFQDDFKVSDQLRVTVGIRGTRVSFKDTALENPLVSGLTFANGAKFNTGDMPDTQYLFEPRVGFNLDVTRDARTIVRGGSGLFSGRPPLVFLSNAIGNNGILTGLVDASDANVGSGGYGFTVNPSQYFTPSTPTLPSTIDLAFTDKNYKFPQVWKTTIAVDQKLPFGFTGTIEGIFSKNINETAYSNANFENAVGTINGPDNRPLFAGNDNGVRINNNVINGILLSNTDKGYFYSTTIKLEYPYKKGLWGSFAYTHSQANDLLSPGSTASGSWTGVRSINGNNDQKLGLSNNNTPHRMVGILGYKIQYGNKLGAATSINLGYIGEQSSSFSYVYGGDLNGDRINGNDLLFVPNKASDLRFVPITQNLGGSTIVLYSEAQQMEAFDKFIDQDPYLSKKRGQYVDRNENLLPMLHRVDLSVTQDFSLNIGGKKNSFQFRADILNFTNLVNRSWGVSQRATNTNILVVNQAPSSTNNFIPGYQMAFQTDNQGRRFLAKDTFQKNASVSDVWQAQFTLRYTFGN
ncbi:carboxypeptidase regulatory-like domain-containing protein [Flavobacterium sp. K77]|uniref:TonB-dependent receptor n=1 Tax=Flavobacterium turcicum TaxID=2764718 RepID=A0ABR7JCP6_9FLAO|nr:MULTISPECIES: carboxypeptidase regulatory-like domain-containing protein [Flavobacterium]MBC5862133.1 TonB-dependent receptor [Flavobacterium turcicum]MCF6139915.1 carboxypeptidase regulatory-like domain-containing protein [Flavobacterium sp. K77]NHL00864.1 TonB-dependent receptor [Flavobacterium turcicum]